MSRPIYWSLLLGCLALSALTAQPAWDIACCPTPVASLSTGGSEVRLAQDASSLPRVLDESGVPLELAGDQVLALADPR
jgi:hypothetical protein